MIFTEKDLKDWFEKQEEKYPNSVYKNQLKSVKFNMFNSYDKNNLLTFLKEKKKEKEASYLVSSYYIYEGRVKASSPEEAAHKFIRENHVVGYKDVEGTVYVLNEDTNEEYEI